MNISHKTIFLFAILMSFSTFAEVSIIVNKANSDPFDAKLIQRIYLGKVNALANGKKIKVFTLKDSAAETEIFRKSALNKSNSQFKAYWSKLAFTGKGTPPIDVANSSVMINAVKTNTTAIGFVNSDDLTTDVRVVGTF